MSNIVNLRTDKEHKIIERVLKAKRDEKLQKAYTDFEKLRTAVHYAKIAEELKAGQ